MRSELPSPGLLNRTLQTFRRAWRSAGLGSSTVKKNVHPDLSSSDCETLRIEFKACLEARSGEVEARTRAADLGATYLALSDTGKRRFVGILARDFDAQEEAIEAAISRYRYQNRSSTYYADSSYSVQKSEANSERHRALKTLRDSLVPPRIRLLTRFNELTLGVKFLVDMRADILRMEDRCPALVGLEQDLKTLLSSWFDIGFLELTRITWSTPAALLEKLFEYEAVHAIRSWNDLKRRLEDDRRCYAFFHPCMPDEPLIFVEIALVDELTGNVHELLDQTRVAGSAEAASTAVFYSISNCQKGLAGVSFGNFLIKQVASKLSAEIPSLELFATLSPIPGFRRWLESQLEDQQLNLSGNQRDTVRAALSSVVMESTGLCAEKALLTLIKSPEILIDSEHTESVRRLAPVISALCARYLLTERRAAQAHDRVAHFHLSNGAQIERINWMGDDSIEGISTSLGMMVNYRYVLNNVDKNHENYVKTGEIVSTAMVKKAATG